MKKRPFPFTSVALRVTGIPDQHQALGHKLEAKSATSHLRGEEILDPSFLKGKKWPHDVWIVTAPIASTQPLSAHLRWIIKKLDKHRAYLHSLIARKAAIDITCTCMCDQERMTVALDSTLLTAISKLGLPLTLKFISLAWLPEKLSKE